MSFFKFLISQFFARQVLLAVVILFTLIFLVFKSLNIMTHHTEKIEVPNLSKKTCSEVKAILTPIELQYVVQDSSEYNPNYPKKSVIKQQPKAGDIVKSKRKIYLTLNTSGYRLLEVPEFLGKTRRNVESTFNAVGFRVNARPIYIPDLGKDVVRGVKYKSKRIKAGDSLPKTSELTLILGRG